MSQTGSIYRYDIAVIDMRTEPTQENPLLKKKGIRRAGANNQVKIIPNLTFRFEKTFSGFHLMAITKKVKVKVDDCKNHNLFRNMSA